MELLSTAYSKRGDSSAVLSLYMTEVAKGIEHRQKIAAYEWLALQPKQRIRLQQESQRFCAGNVALSEEYTQSILLLKSVRRELVHHVLA